jgi:gliding motility-associated-like protein
MRIKKRLRLGYSLFIGVCFFLLSAWNGKLQAQVSGNYTINNNLPTGGRNFSSFNEAIIFMFNGINGPVTFDVTPGSGPYNEQLFLDYHIGSSASKPVVFNCHGATLTFYSLISDSRDGISMDSVDYVTFDSLKIVSTAANDPSQFSMAVHMYHDCDHNTIRNCIITSQTNTTVPQNVDGIVINGAKDFSTAQGPSKCDSNLIINNTISGGNSGITLSSVPSNGEAAIFMKGNQLINNAITNVYDAAIELFYTEDALVQGNDISGGAYYADGTGMKVFEENRATRIIGNRFHNYHFPAGATNDVIGIRFGQPGAAAINEIVVANNLFYDWQTPGKQYGIYVPDPANLKIYHNTFVFDDHSGIATSSTYGVYTENYPVIDTRNNIFTISRTTTGKNYGIYHSNAITTFTSNRNDFYLPGGSSSTNAVGYFGGAQTTLAAWQAKTKLDYQSVSIDPKYSDPANFVYIPTDSSLDNLGEYVNINTDVTGATRNNTHPDAGAYEFLTPPCVTPIIAGAAVLVPGATVCEGDAVALNLSGNSFGNTQTYTWQASTTAAGTYADISAGLAHPAYGIKASSTFYYRAAVTCGATVVYSTPVLLNVNPSLPAGTYTINSAVATGGTNFQTYKEALASISCGVKGPVVFNVAPGSGPYREQLVVTPVNGMSATNTVTFNGNGTTLVYKSTASAERAVIKLNDADYFIFDGLTIQAEGTGSGQYGYGVQLLNNADHNTIRNCSIVMVTTNTSNETIGIDINPLATSFNSTSAPALCDSNTFDNNTITGGYGSIYCTSSSAVPVVGNRFTNNKLRDMYLYGFYLSNTSGTLIEGNDISRPARTNGSSMYGIFANTTQRSLYISKNKVHNPFDGNPTSTNSVYGIMTDGTDATTAEPVIISNNLIYNLNSKGPLNGIANLDADSVQYYHNTISLEDTSANANAITSSSNYTRGFYQSSTATGLVFRDNIITIKRGGTAPKYCLFMNTAGTTMNSDNNDLYMGARSGTTNYIGSYGGVTAATLAAWQGSALSSDNNSLSLYPGYTAPATVDFTPTVQALDNKGVAVGITTDINNQTRHRIPDMGAFEFSVCFALGPITVNIDTAGADMVRFSWNAVTNATGYLVSTDGTNFVTPSSGASGLTHTITGLTAGTDISLYVKVLGTTEDCATLTSSKTTAHTICLALGGKPVVNIDTTGANMVRFSWNAVTNATGYLVSTDGVNFVTPSSGATGLTHTLTGLQADADYSLLVVALGTSQYCPTDTSVKVTAHTICLPLGAAPLVKVDSVNATSVRFSWTAVANATGYRVSTDGVNYVTPSSGPTGLTHTVTGITPGATVSLTVQVTGSAETCPKVYSAAAAAQTYTDQYYVPNTFSPNGNGKSDVFKVHCNVVNTMKLMIFNQWGEKIFESSSQQDGWDGTYKGKQQPVGVYIYVLNMTLTNGAAINKKGTINLIR